MRLKTSQFVAPILPKGRKLPSSCFLLSDILLLPLGLIGLMPALIACSTALLEEQSWMDRQDGPGNMALLIAHPAHELLLYGWLEHYRPIIHILTHGASFGRPPRIDRSKRIIDQTGCTAGAVFGEIADQDLYQRLLDGDLNQLIEITHKLAQSLIDDGITTVVADAAEGEILAHDVWRGMVDAAIDIASATTGLEIQNFEFSIENSIVETNFDQNSNVMVYFHDDASFRRKLVAIQDYVDVADEAERILANRGEDALRIEKPRPAHSSARWLGPQRELTQYEKHGDRQVRSGRYVHSISHNRHLLPLIDALFVERRRVSCPARNAS